jgi:hypothetical protein
MRVRKGTRPTSAPVCPVDEAKRFNTVISRIFKSYCIVYLQGKHFLHEQLMFVDKKTATVRLPRDDIVHSINLELG